MIRNGTVAIGVVAFLIGVRLFVDRSIRSGAEERSARSLLDDQFVRILLENRPRGGTETGSA